jgi:sortase A
VNTSGGLRLRPIGPHNRGIAFPDRAIGRRRASRSARRSRTIGNVLIVTGLGLLILLEAVYSYFRAEAWLDSQQRYAPITAQVAAQEDWPLRPLAPLLSPTPPQPRPTTTPPPKAVAAVPTPTDWPDPLPTPWHAVPTIAPTIEVTVPIRIAIPKIGVNSRIVEIAPLSNGTWGTAAYAVAYHKGTGQIGQADNMVLSGHNNYQGEVFKRLSELKVGDTIKLYSTDREYQYTVVETAIIPWVGASAEDQRRNLKYLLPTSEPTLTLVSCWPYWVYTHRVYIVAKPTA